MTTTPKTTYAEDVPYFQTSQSSSDTWVDRAKAEIISVNGKINSEAYGSDSSGKSAFMLSFTIGNEQYKVIWPVLQSRLGKDKAAKIQAATALYHDIKARVVSAKFLGARSAFFGYLLLVDGQTISQVTNAAFLAQVPQLMSGKEYK